MNSPIAIVMAAGKGTRMKSELPKVLCQANGRPLIRYVLDALNEGGVGGMVGDGGGRGGDASSSSTASRGDTVADAAGSSLASNHCSDCRRDAASAVGSWVAVGTP